ncbi:MAG TPA: hypothetical protein VHG52_13835, partial [Thermomicrobiales bacterium]|nr:hypothetical protein [Thermomicrobiales bacterium]
VRRAAIAADSVATLIGRDLFDWGDADGPFANAQIQHATGIAVDPATGLIYVADTYNNKIKQLDPSAGTVETWLGDGSTSVLFEPHALSIGNGFLYIADTNNHAIRRAELDTAEAATIEPAD